MAEKPDLHDLRGLNRAEGLVEMVVFSDHGQVVQRFQRSTLFVIFDPGNAVAVGKRMIDCAVECGANVTIEVPRRKITREARDRLIARATLVFRSMQEKGRPPAHIAMEVVDVILAAVE